MPLLAVLPGRNGRGAAGKEREWRSERRLPCCPLSFFFSHAKALLKRPTECGRGKVHALSRRRTPDVFGFAGDKVDGAGGEGDG
eukprot:5767207-Pleurochrysis_carterae.AAC.2